jgi:pSer/pThr/pTyr-binding forkhead associated (FHA) protein
LRNDSLDLRWFNESDIRNDPKLAPKKSITLKFHDGALAGQKLNIEDKDRISIGRGKECDIILPISNKNSNISNFHALLIYDRGYWYIED